MIIENASLFVLLILIQLITSIPSNSYYLIPLDTNSSLTNSNYCLNISINKNIYHIPHQCHNHLLCDSYHCDDKSFRCIKIRETLCCLYKYIEDNCQRENLKDQFRSIYFYTSIQHGYCEINLERIEQNDHSYCLAQNLQTTTSTTISLSRLPLKRFQQYRHHSTTQSSNISSKSSFMYTNFIILLLSISL
jgi:hypothetical protein